MVGVKLLRRWLVSGAVIGSLFFAFGCTSHPNDNQIRQMEETRSAALSAEQRLDDLTKQRQQLESELAQKQKELQQCETNKADVQKRLDNWGTEQ